MESSLFKGTECINIELAYSYDKVAALKLLFVDFFYISDRERERESEREYNILLSSITDISCEGSESF